LYFSDSIIADLRRLGVYFGEHRIHLGFFRALSSRFPYAIYYRDKDDFRQVVAVLDLRRSPEWIRDQLTER
jgi:plasmid stabilization system protein ParE